MFAEAEATGYEQDEPIRYVKNDAINSAVETLTTMSAEPWTLRRIVGRMGLGSQPGDRRFGRGGGRRPDLLGQETDIDGFNLSRIVTPEGTMPGDPLSRPLVEIARDLREKRPTARELVGSLERTRL